MTNKVCFISSSGHPQFVEGGDKVLVFAKPDLDAVNTVQITIDKTKSDIEKAFCYPLVTAPTEVEIMSKVERIQSACLDTILKHINSTPQQSDPLNGPCSQE